MRVHNWKQSGTALEVPTVRAHRSLLVTGIAAVAGLAALGLGAQAATGTGDVVVGRGETLSGIAARTGLTVDAIAAANGIADPDVVIEGQVLRLPGSSASGGGTYTVRAGDTLSAIAAAHGISVRALASANGISDPDLVLRGATLTVPGAATGAGRTAAGASTTGTSYTVRAGDTLSAIAARFGVSMTALAAANRLDDRDLVRIGQRLTVPANGGGTGGGGAAAPSGLPARLLASPSRLALRGTFEHWAATYGVPADLLEGLCWLESGWQNGVVSSTGAVGIGQLMPDTVDLVNDVLLGANLDPRDPADNIRMSARFLRYLLDRAGGDTRMALAAYYQGFRAVVERGVYPSTEVYVGAVLALRARF